MVEKIKRIEKSGPLKFNYNHGKSSEIEHFVPKKIENRTRIKSFQSSSKDINNTSSCLYRGMTEYIDYRKGLTRENTTNSEKTTKACLSEKASSQFICSNRLDYQPDLCKDYKETGFCGYGDSCKFLHDRGDYKSGWQIELEEKEKGLTNSHSMQQTIELNNYSLFCLFCNKRWSEKMKPVKTICGHYFHESCALKISITDGRCFFCGKSTKGIFNSAPEIITDLHKTNL
jgi:RING finger protein 113A